MNEKRNFDKLFSLELEHIAQAPDFPGKKPRLLLHACCGPCSSAVLERLADFFDISIFYYNPNIHPAAEYERRLEELGFFLKKRYGRAKDGGAENHSININENRPALIRGDYNPDDFFAAVNIKDFPERAFEAEQGERCSFCYKLRMEKTAHYALKNGFDYFTTTLSISPHKDAAKINAIGTALEKELKAPLHYLYADFKKRNGYKRSLEISAEYGLYRQDYCGCIYSKQNIEERRGQKNP